MANISIPAEIKKELHHFLQEHPHSDLISVYLLYLEKRLNVHPVLYPQGKKIYENADRAIETLEKEGTLWHEAQIQIGFNNAAVNERTKKIYICPFSGKVFGDNTHPNPQDAIYDWVSKCPENTERVDGLKVKRFFVSEDPELIKTYITPRKAPLIKTVYSSTLSGKLFHSPKGVLADFKENHLKPISLVDVPNQNRFEIDENLLQFIQNQLQEDKISAFVEAMAEHEEFRPYVQQWVEGEEG
jgi:hypothetical protein